MAVDIGGMRKQYPGASSSFDVSDLSAREPMGQFKAWFEAASNCKGVEEPNAMCLATADAQGMPSARVVLLKEYGPDGFVFFTNYGSRKGRELSANPNAALVFYWEPMKRQVRVEGRVEKISEEESTKYFDSRPLGSRIGAVISDQSQVIRDRKVLTDKEEEMWAKYGASEEGKGTMMKWVPKPQAWGGYRVLPRAVEFWQGRSSRVHDRLRFRLKTGSDGEGPPLYVEGDDGWVIERLAP